jgi:Heterokaryon incompatibility protein (HET)
METLYQYSELGSGDSTQIRVLHLAQESGEELHCAIEHIQVGKAKFTALSYPWGSLHKRYQIGVQDADGNHLGIIPLTENLNDALHDLRDSPNITARTFWIDQICINQEDKSEQSHQVSLMAQIYSNATQVITYLGPTQSGDAAALNLLARIDAHFSPFYDQPEVADVSVNYYRLEKPPPHLRFNIKKDDSVIQTLYSILLGEWSRRRWMVQENVLNEDTVMLRGYAVIPTSTFYGIMHLTRCSLLPNSTIQSMVMVQTIIASIRKAIHSKRDRDDDRNSHSVMSLLGLMVILQEAECSDPRDLIYAILAIGRDSKTLKIEPDYTKSVRDVFIDVAIRHVRSNNLSSLLHHWLPLSDRPKNLPSWIPPFDQFEKIYHHYTLLQKQCPFDIPDESTVEDNYVLSIKGIQLGTISNHLGSFVNSLSDIFLPEQDISLKDSLKHFLAIIKRARRHVGDSHNLEAVMYYTLLGDVNFGGYTREDFELAKQGWREAISILRSETSKYTRFIQLTKASMRGAFGIGINEKSEHRRHACALIFYGCFLGRALCVTDDGRLCLAPEDAMPGDIIAILFKASALYVLRPDGHGNYIYVGDAYIHGEMRGESVEGDAWREKVQRFRIV